MKEDEDSWAIYTCLGGIIAIIWAWNADISTLERVFWIVLAVIVMAVTGLILAAIETGREAKKAGKAAAKAICEFIDYIVTQIIDFFTVKEQVKSRCPYAFKAQILEKKNNAVNVGIFDGNNNMIQQHRIVSDYGVSNDVYRGQTIYL